MRNCKICGNQVKETDKFCSQCGAKLQSDEFREKWLPKEIKYIKIKVCDLCGEENDFEADECQHCGVGFTGKEKILEREIKSPIFNSEEVSAKKITGEKEKSKRVPQKSKRISEEKHSSAKKLELKHLFMIGLVVIGLGLILVYYAFESSKAGDNQNTFNQTQIQNQPSVDLNAINEINRLEDELKNNPDDPEKLLRLAHLTHDSGFYEKAIGYYEKYLSFNPDDNDAEVDLGVCYFELKQYDKASNIFESVIQKNPKHQIAYLNLGIVNLNQGKVVEAKEYFQKCIALGEHTEAGHRAAELLKSH
ncbi:MAG: tetratricopeptide repeat protein [Ignavibacteria bacterium]|nr:tetratricopeptide repeat protein [Ignavibacteria bacterium]